MKQKAPNSLINFKNEKETQQGTTVYPPSTIKHFVSGTHF